MSVMIPPSVEHLIAADLRLAALRSYGILDTPPEEAFDGIVRLATRLCLTPVGLVSFVAADRQWFKAGSASPRAKPTSTGRSASSPWPSPTCWSCRTSPPT